MDEVHPDAIIFVERILDELNIRNEVSFWHVNEMPENDMDFAKSFGIEFISINKHELYTSYTVRLKPND